MCRAAGTTPAAPHPYRSSVTSQTGTLTPIGNSTTVKGGYLIRLAPNSTTLTPLTEA